MKATKKDTRKASITEQIDTMKQYYRFQSKIYDITRWSFLFGRKEILRILPIDQDASIKILEVGCGTGYNLEQLARLYPNAELVGMDVSEDMVRLSKKATLAYSDRVEILQEAYGTNEEGETGQEQYDVILFSYSLSMINPQWETLLETVKKDLKTGGYVAVVDFHDTNVGLFRKQMEWNHVRMEAHLEPKLNELFEPNFQEVRKAYLGLWEYLLYIGRKA